MNSADLIKRLQQRATARVALAEAANKPENAQNTPLNQSSGWRLVVDAYTEKTKERATAERCEKCCFTRQDDGWCYWMDEKGKTEWLHHWINASTCSSNASTCSSAPVRPGEAYLTLAQKALTSRVPERDDSISITESDAAKKAAELELAQLAAFEFWASNQPALVAAGWSKVRCIDVIIRAGVETGKVSVEGEYIIFNKWSKARARRN